MKKINKNNTKLKTDNKENLGLEEYRKMLERQRKWLEARPGVKVAYYVPPKRKDSDN